MPQKKKKKQTTKKKQLKRPLYNPKYTLKVDRVRLRGHFVEYS